MSVVCLIISCLDVAECENWKERLIFGSYAFCNGLFRVGSIVMILILFRYFTLGLLPLVFLASITAIMRYDPKGRKNYSFLATFLVGCFLPVAVSSEPHKAQYPQNEKSSHHTTNQNRMCMSGKISLLILPIILLFDLILLLVLDFNKEFRLGSRLILGVDDVKNISIIVLYSFFLPTGVAAILSAYILSTRSTRKEVLVVLGVLSTSVLALSIFSPINVSQGNFNSDLNS